MRKAVMIAAAVVALSGAVGVWRFAQSDAAPTAALRLHTVALGDVEDTVSAVGSLQPRNYVDVGTQVSGQLRKIHVEIGDRVTQGQLLAEIDPTVYETRVAADQAQLKVLKANQQERKVQQELAEKQFDRQRRLRETRAASEEAFDTADAARKQLAAQIMALEANSQQVEASLRANQANLGYTRIYAPMSGTVIDVNAKQGQTLNANQQAPIVLRIADLDMMTVQTQVSEADVARLKLGMTARFTTLGRPDRKRVGKLRQILPTPDTVNNVVLYNCLFDVPNPDLDLLPKMSAQVFFITAEAKGVPLAPMNALKKIGRDRYTVKVLENGAAVERTVEAGAGNRVMTEIRRGLVPGDQVVIEPVQSGQNRRRAGSDGPPPDGPGAGGPPPGSSPPGPPPGMTGPRL
jgi:membrane fusion protein, macrolide-specific efflux system